MWVNLQTENHGAFGQTDTFRWEDGTAFAGGNFITTTLDADNQEEAPCLYYDVIVVQTQTILIHATQPT